MRCLWFQNAYQSSLSDNFLTVQVGCRITDLFQGACCFEYFFWRVLWKVILSLKLVVARHVQRRPHMFTHAHNRIWYMLHRLWVIQWRRKIILVSLIDRSLLRIGLRLKIIFDFWIFSGMWLGTNVTKSYMLAFRLHLWVIYLWCKRLGRLKVALAFWGRCLNYGLL